LNTQGVPGALVAIAGDEQTFIDLQLAALEQAGILRPAGAVPPIQTRQDIQSLMSVLASGILFGPAGSAIRSTGDLLTFFDTLRQLYGNQDDRLAEIEFWDQRSSDCYDGEVPVPALPTRSQYDLGLSTPTQFETFRIYVPWIPFEKRGAGLPADFQISGVGAVEADALQALDFSRYFTDTGAGTQLTSLTGPQTYDTGGFLPSGQALPYSVSFQNDPAASTYVNEVRVVTQLDPNLDARSFTLGDIKIGDITIKVPEGQHFFNAEIDFTATRGFILRVAAGIDLFQNPASATWLIQAIDPLTGQVLTDATRGLLKPNDAQGKGAGFVSWMVNTKDDLVTGTTISATARVLFDTQAPEDTPTITQVVDGVAPSTKLTATRIGTTDNYTVTWSVKDDVQGSGFDHVTLYVATDGGDFHVWQRQLTDASGTKVFVGEAGHSYEFLALATDRAGNQEKPLVSQHADDDGSSVNLGGTPTVPDTTPPNFGQPPAPVPTPSTNPLFTAAELNIPNAAPPTRVSEFVQVLAPFTAQEFAGGIAQSEAGIGAMGIVELPDGSYLIAGGANRGSLYKVGVDGATNATLLTTLDAPVFNMAFDKAGRLWATTGGGALLELDPVTGAVLGQHLDGITVAIAVDPVSGKIFVSTNKGVSIFDPTTDTLTQWSRDENLRVNSLAFAPDGTLWAVTWPDRAQVVKFTDKRRAVTQLSFDSPIDSIAFGKTGTALEGLLFVSHNAGRIADTGVAASGSELTMVDVATLRQVALATGGTRGGMITTTSDGRVLLSQTNEVDVLNPVYAPSVVATNPPDQSSIPLPFPFISVTFDSDMFAGTGTEAGSVLNAANYVLHGAAVGDVAATTIVYDASNRTVMLSFGNMLPDDYTLTIKSALLSSYGLHLVADKVIQFEALADLSAVLGVTFTTTRFDRNTGVVSYDVTVTNLSDAPIVLPALLLLDPLDGYAGIPALNAGRTDDGRWLIDLSGAMPPGGQLASGATTSGRTVAIATPDNRRVEFSTGVAASTALNLSPSFTSTPPTTATAGQDFVYDAAASDPEGQAILYHLLTGPAGMTIDGVTGEIHWTPGANVAATAKVEVQAFDSRGAAGIQRFVLDVLGGNKPPAFISLPSSIDGKESTAISFTVVAQDPENGPVTVWADNLPPGASFDPTTRVFSWLPSYDSAGTYPAVTFLASDGLNQIAQRVELKVTDVARPVTLSTAPTHTIREGDPIAFTLKATSEPGATLSFSADLLPWGATLNPTTGEFKWTPSFIQAGDYTIHFSVTDGATTATASTELTVLHQRAAPEFDQQDGWEVFDGQVFVTRVFAFDPNNPSWAPPIRDAQGNLVDQASTAKSVTVTPAAPLPAGMTFDAETLELRWTPTRADVGTHVVSFLATTISTGSDPVLTSTLSFPVTVRALNHTPTIDQNVNAVVQEGGSATIGVHAHDADGNPITLVATSESPNMPLPSFMSFIDDGNGSGRLIVTPTGKNLAGDYVVRIIAQDDGDGGQGPKLVASEVFVVTVKSLNEAPVITPIQDSVAVAGQALSLPISAADFEQDPLAFTITGLPPSATIVPGGVYGKPTLQWQPGTLDIGSYIVTVTVADDGHNGATAPRTDSTTFTLTVRDGDEAPLLDPVGDKSAAEGATLSFQLTANDPNLDPVSFTAVGLPRGATLDAKTGVFTWTPGYDQAGRYTVTFTATDGFASTSETIALVIGQTNRAPVWVPVSDQVAREGAELNVTVIPSDADGDPLKMTVKGSLPTGALFVPATGLFQWTPGFDQQGDHLITLTVTDPSGLSVDTSFTIHVSNVDRAPVLAESDHNFVIGQTRSFTLKASDPDVGSVLSFKASGLPQGATFDQQTGLFTWTPGPGQAGEYFATFTADDGEVETRQTIVLHTTLEPIAPTVRIELTPSFPGVPGQPVLIHPVAVSAADIASLKLYVNGQEVALDSHGRATVTPTAPGRMQIRAVAIDADGTPGEAITVIKTRDPADTAAPAVAFDATVQGAQLAAPTDITGTVADSNLDGWTLELGFGLGDDAGNFHIVATGQASVIGVLGRIDPASLANGFYTLRLTATDMTGRTAVTTTGIEINTAQKTGEYARTETDATVTLGGINFALTRHYDSLTAALNGDFGLGWQLLDRAADIQTSLTPTGRESLGVYAPFGDGTRLYLTRPDGVRMGFTFQPVAEQVGTQTFYHAAWTANDASGWTLTSTDVLLRKAGGHYYAVANGLPYNPASGSNGYRLTTPDGLIDFVIDSARGVTQIDTVGGSLFVSDSGITAANGEALQFLRDSAGRISRVQMPDGTSLVYTYGADGRLTGERNLTTGAGYRYAYGDGRLIAAVAAGGAGVTITYTGANAVVSPVTADLGGIVIFNGAPKTGSLGANGTDTYTFSVRQSEIDSTAGGRLILRIAVNGDGAPAVDGLTPLSIVTQNGHTTALYAIPTEGLYRLRVAGSGAYTLTLSVAGDVTLDGKVDGSDAALAASGAAAADVNGDGVTNATDQQVIAANYGMVRNGAPVVAAILPSVMTHVGLPVAVDLSAIASDPEGDHVIYRIVGTSHGAAALSTDGRYLVFQPDDNYSGAAEFRIVADDGFSASPTAVVAVNVSAAALLHVDFDKSRILFDGVGFSALIKAYADFADQTGVPVPLWYINAHVDDPTVATLSAQGVLTAVAAGTTVLEASRGTIAAATLVGVGDPSDPKLLVSKLYNIDAYPDSVTILPSGGERQVVTSLGTQKSDFVKGAADHVRYISTNTGIATVNADGLITGVAEGEVDIVVIWAYGEDRVHVKVQAAKVGSAVTVGTDGAIVENADGIRVGFGQGQLSGNGKVTITTMDEASLTTPMVGGNTGAFTFAGAFNLDVQGATILGPLQVAVPVATNVAAPGDTVVFFQEVELPIGPNGALQKIWAAVDSGTVGADGMARTASPPFPGLSDRGNVLVARAAQPIAIVRIDLGYLATLSFIVLASMAMAVVVPGAAIAGLALAASLAVAPMLYQMQNIQIWRKYANNQIDHTDLNVNIVPGTPFQTIIPDLPALPVVPQPNPVITDIDTSVGAGGVVTLTIQGTQFADPLAADASNNIFNTRVVFRMPGKDIVVDGADYIGASSGATFADKSMIIVRVPNTVLTGLAQVVVERPAAGTQAINSSTQYRSSAGVRVQNKGGFGFYGNLREHSIDVIDVTRIDEAGPENIIKRIALGNVGTIWETVATNDLSRAFAATDAGVAVIDAFTLQQWDADPNTATLDLIDVGGDHHVTSIAVDPGGHHLYAAGTGVIYVIDLDPGSTSFMKVSATISVTAPAQGYIDSLAVNADGTRLYVSAPATRFFGGTKSWTAGGRDHGVISVINVDSDDKPAPGKANTRRWHEVIGTIDGGIEPWKIQATNDPLRMIFTSRADLSKGLHTIVANDDPTSYVYTKKDIRLVLNAETPGISFFPPSPDGYYNPTFTRRLNSQTVDLDIRNASGVVVTPDLKYAFVADYYFPRMYYYDDAALSFDFEDLIMTGSKIGIVRDPFGPNPTIIGSTTPIPMAFLDSLAMDAAGTKLYANFRAIGNIAVYDVKKMIAKAESSAANWGRIALDNVNFSGPVKINLPPVDVDAYGRGLSLQQNAVLELKGPLGSVDVNTASAQPLVFDWRVETQFLGLTSYEAKLYVSAEPDGQGLWPSDAVRERRFLSGSDPNIPQGDDTNPNRIFTSDIWLKSGHKYHVTADRRLIDDGPLSDEKEIQVTFDPALQHALTAGQFYYWGVEIKQGGIKGSAVFTAKPVEQSSTYGVVTLLTHGFQLGVPTEGTNFEAPEAFLEMGKLIADASGGGVVLQYDKLTGQWVDRATGKTGVTALQSGKAVILVSDWKAESAISDSGFSEAAADAIFASLVDLDHQTNGAIFASALHLIGHSRGTVVNSEIAQRLGTYFPAKTNIQMTTLDPHDNKQETLNIPLQKLAEMFQNAIKIYKAAVVAGAIAGSVG
ncbi:MAG: putative Ig domain-containing protein, partial [Proteobacteria bacterium]|nr:putative Ig domain-containing protein [Pseudomonadota bacterium]